MSQPSDIGHRAYLVRIVQKIAEPAQAILGYQELVIDEVREQGPIDALPDLERVLCAAHQLNLLIKQILDVAAPDMKSFPMLDVNLRHDLRTPMNAILGYSEMVIEDFAETLSESVTADILKIVQESRILLEQIDGKKALISTDVGERYGDDVDGMIAAEVARTIAARASTLPEEKGRILVVDDTASNRDLLARRLGRDGHSVFAAASGKEALRILAIQECDIVLADILMPDMNGIELLGRLKSDDRWREIRVIMISGLNDAHAVISCIEAGAEDYLQKPIDPVLLQARIAACLERSRWRERERHYLAQIEVEKQRADKLLHAILPRQVVKRLAEGEEVIADRIEMATIVFADIVNFTEFAAKTPAAASVNMLGNLFMRFDELADRFGVEKIKTIGDAYMAAAGLPDPHPDHALAAIEFGRALLAETARPTDPASALRLRIGINTGPVIAGLIGRKRFVYDVWGHTVNVASRMESCCIPGHIQISQSTFDAVAGGVADARQVVMDIKGIGQFTTYLLAH
ncbi:MAG: adenylate/guanylate cyclase domain-containing protein [Phyllobacterium sp.]|uniref:adenylate/guanylate cyclase domain-containing protein n=1 Tax=Phyllobacterium sp. TaxID=1871046 RepID=UPI0030F32B60